ncbi:MAG TPA: hypothetical protein VEX13_13410, partial [Chloroflexia bacterium]|nr:hypothetical protein [Chloroflexia bacterium]
MSNVKDLPYCDLVMKGGITSGIAYPPALDELSQKYRFNSIGGTSVGAVAAAGAAAAEFARQRGTGEGGFKTLMDMSTWLSGEGNLFRLFDAPKETSALITLVHSIGAFGGKTEDTRSRPLKFPLAIPRATPLHFLMGLIAGGLIGLALATLIAPGLASSIVIFSSELQWLVPSILVTGALALVSALVVWLAREAIQNAANIVI